MAYSYINKAGGIVSDSTYPYFGADETCKNNLIEESTIEVKLDSRINRCDEDECMQNNTIYKFLQKGPIAVSIDAYNTKFFNYKEGIYNEKCAEPNHAVILVGYGIDQKTKKSFWIIRNSWGSDWGMNGYGYVLNDASNIYSCNLTRYGYQPIITYSKK